MFTHVMLGSSDLERSRRFYDALIGALGGAPATVDPRGRLIYAHRGGRLLIGSPLDGMPATGANGGTIGFLADSSAEVEAWHAAGVANGGAAIEDPPGERAGSRVYLAYLRDPDGNKICALHRPG